MYNPSLCLEAFWAELPSLQLVGCCGELPWRASSCRNNSNSIAGGGPELVFRLGGASWHCGFGANFAAQCTTRSQTDKPESFILSRKSPFWHTGNVTHCRLKAEPCSRMHVKVNTKQERYNLEKSVLHPAPIPLTWIVVLSGRKRKPRSKGREWHGRCARTQGK